MDVHAHSSSPKSVLSMWKIDQENTTYGRIRTIQDLNLNSEETEMLKRSQPELKIELKKNQ